MKRSRLAALCALSSAALAMGSMAASAQTLAPGDPQAVTARPYQATGAKPRPLTVRRHRTAEPMIAAIPVPPPPAFQPTMIVTTPVNVAGAVVGVPFRILGTVFPASGDIATTPLVLIGAPIHAAGEIAQFPFRVINAAFGQQYASPTLFQ